MLESAWRCSTRISVRAPAPDWRGRWGLAGARSGARLASQFERERARAEESHHPAAAHPDTLRGRPGHLWTRHRTAPFSPPATLDDVRPLTLRSVLGKTREGKLWNEFTARYHHLGYKTLVGTQIRYPVHDRHGQPVAMLGFSTAAWKLAPASWCGRSRQWWLRVSSPRRLTRSASPTTAAMWRTGMLFTLTVIVVVLLLFIRAMRRDFLRGRGRKRRGCVEYGS